VPVHIFENFVYFLFCTFLFSSVSSATTPPDSVVLEDASFEPRTVALLRIVYILINESAQKMNILKKVITLFA
jgi:hypothetical protein